MRIRIIDAFTDQPFAGNPAGVCLLPHGPWPDEKWMRQVAAELHLSETAFARPSEADADWDLRWFTPAVESRMCGHATLATTHALLTDGLLKGQVRFSTLSGILVASATSDGEIKLDFPASSIAPIDPPEGLTKILGCEAVGVYLTSPLGDLLVELADEKQLRSLTPDLGAVAQLTRSQDYRGVLVTAAGADEYDFVSRFFAPDHGIPEDPVTGSAHTELATFWAGRLGRDHLTGYQASARGGVVRVALAGDRVHLIGRAVTVLDGELSA
ncbi:PhzF family phenazine biosynthesis protein [Kribbella sp. VKM Ac-2527]|uniref:PhzF family phenazine biosynthesis protein n=1 Tax=Kribbella caucasensis TaxID=2512215 RepID=A0A4R6KPF7_9ACTN|nr:PhzF family phenazine biosynthesis protein [Kribbella sp. VKM Ac-2527]TDO54556.1 PhzF family phenazine biosynthesis protein [Kribbella sp. VKM Ac-2527]